MNIKSKVILFTYIVIYWVNDPAPDVKIEQGIVRGKVSENGRFYEYLGIPYATTTMETRFQPPLPPPTWDGVFKATEEHEGCPQRLFGLSTIFMTGEEDCLKINVYVPSNVNKPLPVMFFIHGGGFTMGSGGQLFYGPDFILKHDVILVTFNYRLGVLGFLCLGIKEAPGNAGLRDQITALKWVKNNIAAFGGNPDNITVFGESAGATSTSILITSEAAKGLFTRAIIQSGSSISLWSTNRYPIWSASLLVELLGYKTKDPYELYKILKETPYNVLTKKRIYKPFIKYFDSMLVHLPCVEKQFDGIERIIKDLPYNILKSGNINKMPIMMGFNNKEGLFMLSREDEETLQQRNEGYMFASDLDIQTEKERQMFSDKFKQFYFGNNDISLDTKLNMTQVYTDTYFGIPEILETEALLDTVDTVYNYFFKYSGGRNIIKLISGYGKEEGAAHADDLLYLFKAKLWPFWINDKDKIVIDRMTTLWTNFAKFGNPTPEVTQILPVKWEPSKKNHLQFLHIGDELEMGPIPNKESYDLWKYVYSRYRRKQAVIDEFN